MDNNVKTILDKCTEELFIIKDTKGNYIFKNVDDPKVKINNFFKKLVQTIADYDLESNDLIYWINQNKAEALKPSFPKDRN